MRSNEDGKKRQTDNVDVIMPHLVILVLQNKITTLELQLVKEDAVIDYLTHQLLLSNRKNSQQPFGNLW